MIGKVLKDVELLEEIGGGGFGAVYKGKHIRNGSFFAVKILPPDFFQHEAQAEQLEREIVTLIDCKHPSILRLETFGFHKDIGGFLITEWLEGRTLNQIWRSHPPLPLAWTLSIFEQLLSAVGYAHQKGIIHQDLKPENIILVPQKNGTTRLVVIDFGIAGALEKFKENRQKIRKKSIGTPNYMAPEQVEGKASEFSASTDLYACGIIFAELISGRQMFSAGSVQATMRLQIDAKAPTLQMMNENLTWEQSIEDFVAKALNKDPKQRFQSAEGMFNAMKSATQSQPISLDWQQIAKNIREQGPYKAPPISYQPSEHAKNRSSKERNIALVIGLSIAIVVGLVAFLLWPTTDVKKKKKRVKVIQFKPK